MVLTKKECRAPYTLQECETNLWNISDSSRGSIYQEAPSVRSVLHLTEISRQQLVEVLIIVFSLFYLVIISVILGNYFTALVRKIQILL